MGKRGPQPGFKRAKAEAAALAQPIVPEPVEAAEPAPALNYADRNNPNRLTGLLLRDFAHARGIARSSMEGKTDEQVRSEVRYIVARSFDAAEA